MDLLIHRLLPAEAVSLLITMVNAEGAAWADGRATAGRQSARVKNNQQLTRSCPVGRDATDRVMQHLRRDPLIKSFALPCRIHGTMFSRSGVGQGYGMHVDNAYMRGGRSDLSFTLFLSDPFDYEGGVLRIQTLQDSREVKLEPGEVVLYPSTSLHEVTTVSRGERLVCVGWIQSHVQSHDDRMLLFGLDAGARALLAEHGTSPSLDLIFQAYGNLLRRFGD
ncbi:Fe2+-dependent dioxygenase [Synechococcus sp. RSCCF101]|uniref:Fe2+-dependent dioxygenase n=1 Tax=Synechococcus sp. RSCCF101 TaxID=2511069 RepID=UPI001246D42B|nr:Fe2+-dependent dioxygenase [Synechococcus sp. RSCCF101]QEY32211.1 Fe2+-dependent dioxygenase [Synechococcus sp. RSCCF101]